MIATLQNAGVDVDAVQSGPGASGMSVAIETTDGAYGAVIVSGENLAFDLDQFAFAPGCKMIVLQNEMAPGLIQTLAQKAKAAGVTVMLNAAPAVGVAAADLANVDILVVNRVEGADVLGQPVGALTPKDTLLALQSIAPHATIILTLGGDGVMFATPGQPGTHCPAQRVAVQSTHGAGDMFVGTLAAALLRAAPLGDGVQAGQDAAARHISQIR